MAEHVLALDLGTTSARAIVVSASGVVKACAAQPLRTFFPHPGWAEQDAEELWSRSLSVLREALARAKLGGGDVAALGIATQRSTVVAWDGTTGIPLAPALVWQDQRAAARVEALHAARIPVPSTASAVKIEWWMRHAPSVAEATAAGTLRLGTPDAWLSWKLSGGAAHVTDPGQASCTVLSDAAAERWSTGLCRLFGVPPETLPRIVASNEVVGEVRAELLGEPIPLAARAGDQQAAAFAQGVRAEGEGKLTLGTSAMMDVHCGAEPGAVAGGVYPIALWRLADGTRAYGLEGSVYTAGAAVDWLVAIGVARDAAEVDALAGSVADAGGVVCVPAFQGLGSPFHDSDARAWIGGLSRGSGRGELARALLEGVAQRCADVAESLAFAHAVLPVDGGLSRSPVLLQAIADLAGVEVRRAAQVETTALGAALLAGSAVGLCADIAVECEARFRPSIPDSERKKARERWRSVVERSRRKREAATH